MTAHRSVTAYDLPQRVASYDADMELMHPNRAQMVRAALDLLPFDGDAPLRALDLGTGTGYFTHRFLERYPRARVAAVDGAAAMADLARARLAGLADRVEFHVADFRDLAKVPLGEEPFDVAFSSFALHHLDRQAKQVAVATAVARLRAGGWFLNADLIVADDPAAEAHIQRLRVQGIVRRAAGADSRFRDAAATRAFLDALEEGEADQPLTLEQDLAVLRGAGLRGVAAYWLEHRELVSAGWS